MILNEKVTGKAEKAYAVYNGLKEIGFNVDIYMYVPDAGRFKGKKFIAVDDNSHVDCEGNPYTYTFDPQTGKEVKW